MKPWMGWMLATVVFWGSYVPILHIGQQHLKKSGLHAFLFVGLAYFLLAVMIPGAVIAQSNGWQAFTMKGALFSSLAGAIGALGALGMIFALRTGGHPLSVAPIVFAGAPIVNTILASLIHPPKQSIQPLYWVGVIFAAVGAYLVLAHRPQ